MTLHARTAETPLFNPVFQLGLELSRQIESGALKLGEVAALVAELECEGLQARANRIIRTVTGLPVEEADALLLQPRGECGAGVLARSI